MKLAVDDDVSLELEFRLQQRIGNRVRNLRVLRCGDRLILEGTSNTFYAKQLATHALLELAPGEEFCNEITVERR